MSVNWWGLLFPLLFVAGLTGLVRAINSLLLLTDKAVVARAPARSGERLKVPEAGVYDLCLEGRTFSRDFLGVRYSLHDAAGEPIPIRLKLSRTKVSGLGTTRISVGWFELSRAAELSLSVEGMSAQAQQRCSFVIQRPIGAGIALRVVALVLTGAATIGGVVGSVLAWLPA